MTGPAARGTERGTRAPSRVTGTQGAVGAVLVVLALGLALRLIIAYLLPGSGFGVDLGAFRAWAANLASQGLNGFYQRDFFHDYTPGLPVRAVGVGARRAGHRWGRCRPHQGAGDPRRPGHRLARLVDGPRARRPAKCRAGRGVRRGRQPDQLVRQRGLGPGRLGRRRLPPAGAARAVARPPGAVGDLRRGGRADQAAARDPDPDPGAGHDPAGALAGREDGRRPDVADLDGGFAGRRLARPPPRLGAAHRPSDPHPHDRPGRPGDDDPPVLPVRPVGPRVQVDRAVLLVWPPVADLRHRLGLSVPDGQRVQPVGAGRRRHRLHPRQFGAVGLRRAVDGHRGVPVRRRLDRRASRRSSSVAR